MNFKNYAFIENKNIFSKITIKYILLELVMLLDHKDVDLESRSNYVQRTYMCLDLLR